MKASLLLTGLRIEQQTALHLEPRKMPRNNREMQAQKLYKDRSQAGCVLHNLLSNKVAVTRRIKYSQDHLYKCILGTLLLLFWG
jgi:hypothetical protein